MSDLQSTPVSSTIDKPATPTINIEQNGHQGTSQFQQNPNKNSNIKPDPKPILKEQIVKHMVQDHLVPKLEQTIFMSVEEKISAYY